MFDKFLYTVVVFWLMTKMNRSVENMRKKKISFRPPGRHLSREAKGDHWNRPDHCCG